MFNVVPNRDADNDGNVYQQGCFSGIVARVLHSWYNEYQPVQTNVVISEEKIHKAQEIVIEYCKNLNFKELKSFVEYYSFNIDKMDNILQTIVDERVCFEDYDDITEEDAWYINTLMFRRDHIRDDSAICNMVKVLVDSGMNLKANANNNVVSHFAVHNDIRTLKFLFSHDVDAHGVFEQVSCGKIKVSGDVMELIQYYVPESTDQYL